MARKNSEDVAPANHASRRGGNAKTSLRTQLRDSNGVKTVGLVSIAVPSIKLLGNLIEAKKVLETLGVATEVSIVAAHWAPKKTLRYIAELESGGVDVVIAAADGSAHLPGMIASLTTIPVIGVPLEGANLHGLDSLLSIVQMPKGVPVATMAIDSGYNAGIYACQILCLKHPELRQRLVKHKEALEKQVESDDLEINATSRIKMGDGTQIGR